MNCPETSEWELVTMGLRDGPAAEALLEHARACAPCRRQLDAARRNHIQLMRAVEVFDADHDRLRESLLAALPGNTPDERPVGWAVRAARNIGDMIMSTEPRRRLSLAAALAVAACIVLAVTTAFHGSRSAVALADVSARLRSVKALVCRQRETVVAGGEERIRQVWRLYMSTELGTRADLFDGETLVHSTYCRAGQPTLFVNPPGKTLTYLEVPPGEAAAIQGPEDQLKYLRDLSAGADRRLGRETVDGHEAEGFEIDGARFGLGGWPNRGAAGEERRAPASIRVWVDAATKLPLRLVIDKPGQAANTREVSIQDQYRWDGDVEPVLFDPPALPVDYTELHLRQPPLNEESLLAGLRRYAEIFGKYPDRVDRFLAADVQSPDLLALDASATQAERLQALYQAQYDLNAISHYANRLFLEQGGPEYFGDRVRPGSAEEVLMRWRVDGGRTRVIYGDLRSENFGAGGR